MSGQFNFVNLCIDFRLMRYLVIIFLAGLIVYSCAKPKTKDPKPAIEFKNFNYFQIAGRDTAILTIGYEDGDGDIFMDNNSTTQNLFITPYSFKESTNKFESVIDPITKDTFRISYIAKQPDNGYYKGKSIKGDIIIPLREFRVSDDDKILKYAIFVVDQSGKKSNVVGSPVFTVNF
jgi:hypothetical protein